MLIDARLRRRAVASLAWCELCFDHADHLQQRLERPIDGPITALDKFAIETALFLNIVARVADGAERRRIDRLAEACASLLFTPRVSASVVRFPKGAPAFGLALHSLQRLGLQNRRLAAALRETFEAGDVEGSERAAYRAVEVQWVRGLLGLETLFDPHVACVVTNAGMTGHGLTMTEADFYAVTHTLMYLTDFGRRAPPRALSVPGLRNVLRMGIVTTLLSENLDVMAELLLAAATLRVPFDVHERFALDLLLTLSDELGFLPSPTLSAATAADLDGDALLAYTLEHSYHTCYVSGMLTAVLLERGPDIAARNDMPSAGDQACELLEPAVKCLLSSDPARKPLACLRHAGGSTFSDRELSVVLGDAALVSGIRVGNLGSITEVLEGWRSSAAPFTTIATEVLRTLLRRARYAEKQSDQVGEALSGLTKLAADLDLDDGRH